jgi:hypothetical protein
MMNPSKLILKAGSSSFYKWLLNRGLWNMIPFNKPHKLRVTNIQPGNVEIKLPYIRRNLNHIKGLHACSMATLAEYATGMALITKLDSKIFRIIMQKIEMEYFYQGKTDATASFEVTDEWLNTNVLKIIKTGSPAVINCEIHIHDIQKNKLATGNIFWQIKSWADVKTSPA